MRRAALRGCALLLRRSGSAASEPHALLAAGLQAAAAGGPDVLQQLGAPSWQAATLYAAASCGRRAASSSSDGSSNGSAGSSDPGREWVGRSYGSQLGKPVPVRPELAAELRSLAVLAGVADTAKLSRNVAALGPKPERRVVEHGAAVVQLLLSLGVPKAQLATLLERCPLLFSRPAEQRVALLFGQLAQLGLTAVEAARCFEQQPTAANVRSFEPAIAVLAELFAAGSKAGGSRSGEQLLGDLLRRQPAAIGLLDLQPDTLQQRIDNLVQRYGPHWKQQNKQAVIVAAMQQQSWSLLARPPAHLLAQEAVLQQEVGQQPGDSTRLLAGILQYSPLAASCSEAKLRRRLQSLAAGFGRQDLLQAPAPSFAMLLAVDSAVWQRALAVWQLLGVPAPAALATSNLQPLAADWLGPGVLAKLAALQQLLPWRPTAAEAVQQSTGYVARPSPERLIGRLLFLQQEGVLPLLVADKAAAQREWRRQHGLPANRRAAGQPQLVSLCDTATLSDAKFCALLAAVEAAQPEQPGHGGVSGSGTAKRYHSFMAQLPQLPAYQSMLAEGAAESRRLAALLPPELLPQPHGSA